MNCQTAFVSLQKVSSSMIIFLVTFFISNYYINGVDGHAIFWEPPSRASLGKHNMNFCKVPVNNNHMSLWCGGIVVGEDLFLVVFCKIRVIMVSCDLKFIGIMGVSLKESGRYQRYLYFCSFIHITV